MFSPYSSSVPSEKRLLIVTTPIFNCLYKSKNTQLQQDYFYEAEE